MPSPEPPEFGDLRRELDLWEGEGRVAVFWWRDDDATAPTPALTRLLDLSDAYGIEVAVAVIPATADPALTEVLGRRDHAAILQHGYAHRNHAPAGKPAVECGGERPVDQVLDELAAGRRILERMFGVRFRPILAAPWNRIERPVLKRLDEAGFRGASAAGPRAAMQDATRLPVINIHVDPVNWKERRFAGTPKALSSVIGELEARRKGASDADEPLGLLTHHLDHDSGLWEFLGDLFSLTTSHPAARWITVDEAFGARAGTAAERAAVT
jgi:hypothetical protein